MTADPTRGLRGDVQVAGDKSISHRALILGGLAAGTTQIRGLLEGDDVLHTARAVQAFGASVTRLGIGEWRVKGMPWRSPRGPIDCGNSGTGARLLMGAAAGFSLEAQFVGDASLSRRPMERVLRPLRDMGAKAEGTQLPVTIRGGRLSGISFSNEKASAQVKSAILLAGLRAEGEVEVVEPLPSRDHTENMLKAFGCDVQINGRSIRLGQKRTLSATDIEVPGDPSSAAFFIVAALIVPGSEIRLRNVMINPLRTGLFDTLIQMGGKLEFENRRQLGAEQVADIIVRSSNLRGVEIAAERAPAMIDEYPILAVAAACASGPTVMRGLAELRVKESDRLATIVAGLKACGVEAEDDGDTLFIKGCGGPPPGGARVSAEDDHRIAMSFLVMGLAARRSVSVDSSDMIATSFPEFPDLMRTVGGSVA